MALRMGALSPAKRKILRLKREVERLQAELALKLQEETSILAHLYAQQQEYSNMLVLLQEPQPPLVEKDTAATQQRSRHTMKT